MKKSELKRFTLTIDVALMASSPREADRFLGAVLRLIGKEWRNRPKLGAASWSGIVEDEDDGQILFERADWDRRMSEVWEDIDSDAEGFKQERSKVKGSRLTEGGKNP